MTSPRFIVLPCRDSGWDVYDTLRGVECGFFHTYFFAKRRARMLARMAA